MSESVIEAIFIKTCPEDSHFSNPGPKPEAAHQWSTEMFCLAHKAVSQTIFKTN